MRRQLIEARRAKELTQKDLGLMLGLSDRTIGALERSRIKSGKPEMWDRLEAVLEVDQRILRQVDPDGGT